MSFLTGYVKRKAITVSNANVDSALTDFPVLVVITADSNIGAVAASNGNNIRFTSSDGTTTLDYEKQSFSISGGNASGIFWVQVPTVSSASNTTIYIYYDNSGTSDGQNINGTWDSNFVGVYHCEQDPSGSAPQIMDSTGNALHATASGMTGADSVAGQIGNALHLAASQSVALPSISSFFTSEGTYSLLIKKDSNASTAGFDSGGTGISNATFANHYRYLDVIYDTTFISSRQTVGSGSVNTANWHHVAITSKPGSNNWIFYQNGVSIYSAAGDSSVSINSTVYLTQIALSYYLQGAVDECRLSNIARTAAWIKFEYHNTFDTDNNLTFGSEETDGGGALAIMPFVLDSANERIIISGRSITMVPC